MTWPTSSTPPARPDSPKGVAIEHRQATALVDWAHRTYSREELAGVLASTSICFDLSVFELFATLTAGGTVVLAENALELPDLPGPRPGDAGQHRAIGDGRAHPGR